MARFGFIGSSYTSQSINADYQFTMNWYEENNESGMGKSGKDLYPTPGLIVNTDLTAGTIGPPGIRGIFNWSGPQSPPLGRCFVVADKRFIEIYGDGTFFTYPLSILNDGTPVSFAASGTEMMFTSAGNLYHFLGNPSSFLINLIPISNVAQVAYVDGFFVIWITSSNQVRTSAPGDGTVWPALSETNISVFPDNLVSMLADHRELWLFGAKQIAVYYNSGNFPFPLDVVSGGYIENSTIAEWSPARIDNSVFWLGGDERGNAVVWRANGYTPQRVSNHAVEFAMQGYAIRNDAIGYAYQDQGHSFYVLRFPNADHTWVYDVATGQWHERGWLNNDGSFSAHHSTNHAFVFGKHLVGDWKTSTVYQMAIGFQDDAGNPISRIRRAPHISNEAEWLFHQQFQLDMETNQGIITGPAVSTSFNLLDSQTHSWNVTINPLGILQTALAVPTAPQGLFINNNTNNTSWQIIVTPIGILQVIPTAYNGTYPTVINMNSTPGPPTNAFALTVNIFGLITINPIPTFGTTRPPQIFLQWSDDGGHTWSNSYPVFTGSVPGSGPQQNWKTRVLWRRLGRSRDRVYQVQAQDAVPWRLIDGYLMASPGFQPTERLAKVYGKSA